MSNFRFSNCSCGFLSLLPSFCLCILKKYIVSLTTELYYPRLLSCSQSFLSWSNLCYMCYFPIALHTYISPELSCVLIYLGSIMRYGSFSYILFLCNCAHRFRQKLTSSFRQFHPLSFIFYSELVVVLLLPNINLL